MSFVEKLVQFHQGEGKIQKFLIRNSIRIHLFGEFHAQNPCLVSKVKKQFLGPKDLQGLQKVGIFLKKYFFEKNL